MRRRSLLGLGGAATVSVATALQGRSRPGRHWLHTWVSMPQLT